MYFVSLKIRTKHFGKDRGREAKDFNRNKESDGLVDVQIPNRKYSTSIVVK